MDFDRKHTCRFETETPHYGRTFGARHARAKAGNVNATGILIKLGVCLAVCALVLVLKMSQNSAAAVSASAQNPAEDFDESLGKLKFVELPGILDVFAAGSRYDAGFEYASYEAMLDDTLVSFVMRQEQSIPAPAASIVKEIIEDAELGTSVALLTARDEEIIYHGFSSVSAEPGQQLAAGDYIGAVAAGGLLTVKANVEGRPVPPEELIAFDTEKAL